jgi:hypothetical protein
MENAGHLNHDRVLDQSWDKRSVVPSLLAKEIVAKMVHERERREKRKIGEFVVVVDRHLLSLAQLKAVVD